MNFTAHLDKLFIVIGLLAIPNLYFSAEYNVSLMIFCYFVWGMQYRPVTLYLLIFSWVIDGVRMIYIIGDEDKSSSNILFILLTLIFVMKLIAIIQMIVYIRQAREALIPQNMCQKLHKTFSD